MSALLLALFLVPLIGAAVCGVMARREDLDRAARTVGLVVSGVALVLVVAIWTLFRTGPGTPRFQGRLSVEWIPAFGTNFALGLDGIALTMIALLCVLVPIVLVFAAADKLPPGRTGAGFTALILATQGVLVGVFAATDVFLFYVLFEAMLIPMYFLIGRFGGPRRQYAAVKFFLYSFLGGLIMLASVIGLFVASDTRFGEGTFDWTALQGMAAQLPLSTQIPLFLGFFAAFAIKAPLVPFHTWLPDAGAEAPIAGSIILLGLLDKVGTFGFLRYTLPLFPAASQELAPLVLTLAVIGVLYGALLAAAQTDLKRFVAYTSIAHFGFIALGIFAFSSQSIAGSALYMVNHGISTAMLFLVVGLLIRRGGTSDMTEYGGVGRAAPLLAGVFLVAGLSTIALPGTNSFVSEFLVLLGSFPREPVFTVIATVGIVFAALYMLWVFQRTMTGPLRGAAVVGDGPGAASAATLGGTDTGDDSWMRRTTARFGDLTRGEIALLTPLVALVLVLGFFPGPVLDVLEPTVASTLSEVGVADAVTPNGVPR
jgi:NADH-quinone oxidoreductase subunit M